jgi:hypothetical protein
MTQTLNSESLVRQYLDAFGQHDISRCMAPFTANSVVVAREGTHTGLAEIEQWHRDRFAGETRILELKSVQPTATGAVADMQITSARLADTRLKSISGKMTFEIDNGVIKHAVLEFKIPGILKLFRR